MLIMTACSSSNTPDTSLAEANPETPAQGANPGSVNQAITCSSSSSDIQNAVLVSVNQFRAESRMCGSVMYPAVAPMSWNTTLEETARIHSMDMANANFFSHTGSNGLSSADRATNAGYNWMNIGENIAGGQQTVDEAMTAWIESPSHCQNIMSPDFKETATACVSNPNTELRVYWTSVYGTEF